MYLFLFLMKLFDQLDAYLANILIQIIFSKKKS